MLLPRLSEVWEGAKEVRWFFEVEDRQRCRLNILDILVELKNTDSEANPKNNWMRGEQACLVEDDDDEEEEENGDHDIGVPVKSRPIGPVPP